jgi:hypothetical protein
MLSHFYDNQADYPIIGVDLASLLMKAGLQGELTTSWNMNSLWGEPNADYNPEDEEGTIKTARVFGDKLRYQAKFLTVNQMFEGGRIAAKHRL